MPLRNFSWLLEGKVAGAAVTDSPDNLKELKGLGIRAIVCLVEWPVDEKLIRDFGFEYLHLKVPSFMAPTQEQIDIFVKFAEEMEKRNKPFIVCCREGWGRTGTMLASYLVRKGLEPDVAIQEVRTKRPRSVESAEQEEAVRDYASRLRRKLPPI